MRISDWSSDVCSSDLLPPLPRKATKEEWAAMTKNERVARARHRKAIKDLRQAASVDAETFAVDMELAGFLEEEGTFYIPHSLDWRSRVYAVSFFNFQRDRTSVVQGKSLSVRVDLGGCHTIKKK